MILIGTIKQRKLKQLEKNRRRTLKGSRRAARINQLRVKIMKRKQLKTSKSKSTSCSTILTRTKRELIKLGRREDLRVRWKSKRSRGHTWTTPVISASESSCSIKWKMPRSPTTTKYLKTLTSTNLYLANFLPPNSSLKRRTKSVKRKPVLKT